MADQAAFPNRSIGLFLGPNLHPVLLAIVALPLAGFGVAYLPGTIGLALLAAALSILLVAGSAGVLDAVRRRRGAMALDGAAAVIAHDPSPSFCADAEGRIVAQNAAFEARFGPCLGKSVAAALSGLLINPTASVLRQERARAQFGHARDSVFTRDGHVRLSTHRAGSGAVWRIEEAGSGALKLGEAITLPMLVASRNGTILSINPAMRALLGHRARDLTSVFGETEIRSGARMQLSSEDGPVMATVIEVPGEDGRREIYAYATEDPTAELSGSDVLFETMPVAALVVRADGTLHAQNDCARQLLCIDAESGPLKIGDVIEGPGRPARDWMKDIADDRAPNRSEVVRMLRGEGERSVKITVTRLPGPTEPRLLAVLQDATELQDLQAQFAQSQKMQAIGELAGGVAHDFNNLLTAITGHCDLLLLRHDQGDQDYADLVQIHQNANRAASLVGQLLAFSRKQTMKPELLDLADTMAELTHLLNRLVGERVTLELSQDSGLQPIWADRRLLDQVLMNLVVNARDAMPDGGPIRITSRMMRLEHGLQRNNAHVPPGTYVAIEVSDEGIGIPEDRLGRIFEPFFTTKRVGEGTGLGLSMAYGIMKQSGGYIFCDSVPWPRHDVFAGVSGP